jgi:hypothetical protein
MDPSARDLALGKNRVVIMESGGVVVVAAQATERTATARKKSSTAVASPCAAGGCELPGLKLCAGCKGVWYCGPRCQKEHWKLHKTLCGHVREGKGAKLKRSELQIAPWTASTPYEVRDADFGRFDKRFEKDIAAFAEECYRDDGLAKPGLVVVALERQRRPLDLRWAPLAAANRPGGPCIGPQTMEEIRKDHALGAFCTCIAS